MENGLLHALVPPSIARRLCTGEELIADRYESTTVMFIYLDGYQDLLFSCGTSETIKWLNAIFCKFDDALHNFFPGKVFKVSAKHYICFCILVCMLTYAWKHAGGDFLQLLPCGERVPRGA